MSLVVADGVAELQALVGINLGCSEYIEIGQAEVNRFLAATGGKRKTDDDSASADGPEPTDDEPIPTYLPLALGPVLYPQVLDVRGFAMAVNYGLHRARFGAPLPVRSRLRVGVTMLAVDELVGGAQTTLEFAFEADGVAGKVCVAEVLFRWYL